MNGTVRLTATASSNVASVVSKMDPATKRAALATTVSMRPNASTAACTERMHPVSPARSSTTVTDRRPSAATRRPVASARSS